jgi:hypothetical protein
MCSKKVQKWGRWIKIIMDDIQMVYFHRNMYDGLIKLVEKYDQQDKETLFFAFLYNIFVDSLVMGIRRQLKGKDKNSISIARLLEDIKNYAANDAPDINKCDVKKDLAALKDACNSAETLADRRVAHIDKRSLEYDPTLQELIKDLEHVGQVASKYYGLIMKARIELYPRQNVLPWPRPWIDIYYKKRGKIGPLPESP